MGRYLCPAPGRTLGGVRPDWAFLRVRSRGFHRQQDAEGGARSGRGDDLDPALVSCHQCVDDRQTETGTAELGERAGRVFTLENLNTAVDHPGTPFARAADTMALVEAVDSSYLRMNLDLYHAQIGEGNLIQLLERALPLIGEIQVADVPGRQEPGTGEIHYPAVAAALDRLDYHGVVGLEGWASSDPDLALDRFRAAFTT